MKLHEYQAKEIMSRFGIPVPPGRVATTPAQAAEIALQFGGPVAIKAQVLVGGRGKVGGIRIAQTVAEAQAAADAVLGMTIGDQTVDKVLVTPAVGISQELYLGAILDRSAKNITFIASSRGGVEIEETARTAPNLLLRVTADPFLGLSDFQARQLGFGIGLPTSLVPEFTRIAKSLYSFFVGCDASLAEINPLVITREGALLALDAKLLVDDNGLVRHPDLATQRPLDDETFFDREARKLGLAYVKMDGSVGCLVNGAGLAMATMDMISLHGGKPANFLDIGGGSKAERVAAALRLVFSDPDVKVVLVNIFGGITRCDEVAKGVVSALQVTTGLPVVVRLAGTNEEEGRRIVAEAKIRTAVSLREAAGLAVELGRISTGRGS